jgi:hypothetical protein
MGDWVAITGLGLHVKETTDSGVGVAALWICLFGPSVLVAADAGLLIDCLEATRVLAIVSALGAIAAVVLAFSEALAPVLVLTAVLGVVFALMSPAELIFPATGLWMLTRGERSKRWRGEGESEPIRAM